MAPRPVRFSVRLGAQGVPSRLEGSALYVLAARGAHRLRTGEAPVQSRGTRWAEPLMLTLTIYEAPDGTLEEKHIALTLVEAAGRGNEERLGTYTLDMARFREGPSTSVVLQTDDMYAVDAPQLKVDVEVGAPRDKLGATPRGTKPEPEVARPPPAPEVQSVNKLSDSAGRLSMSLGFRKVGGSPKAPSPGVDAVALPAPPDRRASSLPSGLPSCDESDGTESLLTVSDISGFTDSGEEEEGRGGEDDSSQGERETQPSGGGRLPGEAHTLSLERHPSENQADANSFRPQQVGGLPGREELGIDERLRPGETPHASQAAGTFDNYGDLISSSEEEEEDIRGPGMSDPSTSPPCSSASTAAEDDEGLSGEFCSPRTSEGKMCELFAATNGSQHGAAQNGEEAAAEFDQPLPKLQEKRPLKGFEGGRTGTRGTEKAHDAPAFGNVSELETAVAALQSERSTLQAQIQNLEEQSSRERELRMQQESDFKEESRLLREETGATTRRCLAALRELGGGLAEILSSEAGRSSREAATVLAGDLSKRLGAAADLASKLEFDAKCVKGLASDKQLLLSEVERLDLKVQTLQAKAVDTEVELLDLREAAPKARAEIDMLQEQVAQLERELEVRFEEARTVNAKLGEVHGVYDSLLSQLDATQTEQEELHEVVEMLKDELEGKELLHESLETSQSECDSLRGALRALQGELAALRESRGVQEEVATGEAQALRDEAQTLREQVVRLAASVADVQAARDRADAELATQSLEVQTLKNSLKGEFDKRAYAERHVAALQADMEVLQVSEIAMREALANSGDAEELEKALLECTKLRGDLEGKENLCREIEEQLEALRRQIQVGPSAEDLERVAEKLKEVTALNEKQNHELIETRGNAKAGKRVSELESELEVLRISEAAMREALELDGVKRVDMAEDIESLEVQLQEERSRSSDSSAKVAALEDDLQIASKKANMAERALRDAHEAKKNLLDANNRADGLETELEAARRQSSDRASAQAEAERLRDEQEILKARTETLESELKASRQTISERATEQSELLTRHEHLETELQVAREECSTLHSNLEASQARAAILENNQQASEERTETLKSDLEGAREEVSILGSSLRADLEISQAEVTRLHEELRVSKKEAEEALLRCKTSGGKMEEMEASLTKSREEGADMVRKLTDKAQEDASLIELFKISEAQMREEVAKRSEEVKTLKSTLEKSGVKMAEMTNRVADLEDRLGESEARVEAVRESERALRKELDSTTLELDKAAQELNEERAEATKNRGLLEKRKALVPPPGEIRRIKEDLDIAEGQLKYLRKDFEEKSKEANAANRKVEELQSEAEVLRVSESSIREALSISELKAVELQKALDTQEQTTAGDDERVARLQIELEESRTNLPQQSTAEDSLRKDLEVAQSLLATQQAEKEKAARSASEAQELARASKLESATLGKELEAATRKLASLGSELVATRQEKEQVTESLLKARNDMEEMAALEQLSQRNSQTEEAPALQDIRAELKMSQEAEQRAQSDLARSREELSGLSITVERSALKIAEAVAQVAEMEDQLELKDVELRNTASRLQGEEALLRQIEALSEESSAATPLAKSVDELKLQLEALNASNSTMKGSIQDLSAENASLKATLKNRASGSEDAEDLRMQIVVLSGKVADAEARNEELQHAIRCAKFAASPAKPPGPAPSPMRRFFGGQN